MQGSTSCLSLRSPLLATSYRSLASLAQAAPAQPRQVLKKPGLPFQSRAQWEHEERQLVRQGLSPFAEEERARKRGRTAEIIKRPPPHLDASAFVKTIGAMIDRLEIIEAYAKVKVADRQRLRPITFNILIAACLRTGKEQLALDVFALMRQRGFSPTPHTFGILIGGLNRRSKISPRLRDRIKHIHRQWVSLYQQAPETWTNDQVASFDSAKGNVPTNAFISLVGRCGDVATMYEAFYAMPKSGPRAPDLQTYTIMLQALAQRGLAEDVESAIPLWNLLVRDEQVGAVDGQAFSALSEALQRGKEVQRLALLQLARECFGFGPTVVENANSTLKAAGLLVPNAKKRRGVMQLHYKALSSIFGHLGDLRLAGAARKWLAQIVADEDKAAVLDAVQVEKLLYAFARHGEAKAAEDILTEMTSYSSRRHQPTRTSFAYALQAALATKDFARALRILNLHITSLPPHPLFLLPPSVFQLDESTFRAERAFSEDALQHEPKQADVKCMAIIVELASSSSSLAALRAISLAEALGWLPWVASAPSSEPLTEDPDATSPSTQLTVVSDDGSALTASQHALSLADRAEQQGDVGRARFLRDRAKTLAEADASVRAHYLYCKAPRTTETDPTLILRAASKEAAMRRERYRLRYWEPKLARSLLKCIGVLWEQGSIAKEHVKSHREALIAYFGRGRLRGVKRREESEAYEVGAQVVDVDQWASKSYSGPAVRKPDGSRDALLQREDADEWEDADTVPALQGLPKPSQQQIALRVGNPAIARPAYFGDLRGKKEPEAPTPRATRAVMARAARAKPALLSGARTRRETRPEVVIERGASRLRAARLKTLDDIRPRNTRGI